MEEDPGARSYGNQIFTLKEARFCHNLAISGPEADNLHRTAEERQLIACQNLGSCGDIHVFIIREGQRRATGTAS